ncbi:unnamed protein product [Symbiodinium sp. KB8]|nr:unnamed protein product [Symbiodinium sp. KB8]
MKAQAIGASALVNMVIGEVVGSSKAKDGAINRLVGRWVCILAACLEVTAEEQKHIVEVQTRRTHVKNPEVMFQADVAKLEDEIAATEKQQLEAYMQLQQAANTGMLEKLTMGPDVVQEWAAACEPQEAPVSALTQELHTGHPMAASDASCGGSCSECCGSGNRGPSDRPVYGWSWKRWWSFNGGARRCGTGLRGEAPATHQRPKGPEGTPRQALKPAAPPKGKTAAHHSPSLADKVEAKRDALKAAQIQAVRAAFFGSRVSAPVPAEPAEMVEDRAGSVVEDSSLMLDPEVWARLPY